MPGRATGSLTAPAIALRAAADGAADAVSKRIKIDMLGAAARDIAADGTADHLNDEIDEHTPDMTPPSPEPVLSCSPVRRRQ